MESEKSHEARGSVFIFYVKSQRQWRKMRDRMLERAQMVIADSRSVLPVCIIRGDSKGWTVH